MSSALTVASYGATQPPPSDGSAVIRGATSASRGSAGSLTSGPDQPGSGTQSESRNATSGVVTARRPALRAAAGPRAVACRSTSAPCRPAVVATPAGAGGAPPPPHPRGGGGGGGGP